MVKNENYHWHGGHQITNGMEQSNEERNLSI